MTSRARVGLIYLTVIVMTLLLRVSSALDVYGALGVENSDAFFTCVVQLLIFGVLPLFLYSVAVARDGRDICATFRDFGFRKIDGIDLLLTLGVTICTVVVANGVSYAWQAGLQSIGYTHVSSPTDYANIGVFFREVVLVALLPAVFEEITHRGLIYAGYARLGPRFVLVSALLFSLMHQNIVQTGYTFLDGVVIAMMMYYTGSILPGMILHFCNNFYSVFSGYIAQNGGIFNFVNIAENWLSTTRGGTAVSIIVFLLCACILALLILIMRRRAVKRGLASRIPFGTFFARYAEYGRGTDVVSCASQKPLYKDAPFLIIVMIGVACAVFTLIWGILR